MFKNFFNLKLTTLSLIAVLMGTVLFVSPGPVEAGARLRSSNVVTVHDVSANNPPGGWARSVAAIRGALVEFRVEITNEGDDVADHVQLTGQMPNNIGNSFNFPVIIQSAINGGSPVNDSVTVTVIDGSNQQFAYEPGHVRIAGVTNLHNCPNVCNIGDAVVTQGGFEVGDIGAGQTIQVLYKARMSNVVVATPTPTPTTRPAATPTPTPTSGAGAGQGGQSQGNCTGANSCSGSANVTVNTPPAQVALAAAAPRVVSAATAGVSELPKTGLPLAGLGLAGLLPIGLKLRKFGKGQKDDYSAKSIWEERELSR